MNAKSIFKKLVCPKCRTWKPDSTGKATMTCQKCGLEMAPSVKWHVRITREGKTIVKAVSSRRTDAENYLFSAKDAIRRGALLPGEEPEITWDAATKIFKKWINGLASEKTRAFYTTNLKALEKTAVAGFAELTLQEIEPCHFAAYRDARLLEVSPKTVNSEMGTLCRMYTLIMETRPVRKYPALHAAYTDLRKVKFPEPNNEKTRYLDIDGFKKLIAECTEPHIKMVLIIGIKTLLRKMNILSLRRQYFDFKNHTITIPRPEMKSKKTRGDHVVPMDSELEELIKRWMMENRTFDYLFPSPRNPRTHIKSVSKGVNAALERAGINKGVVDRREKITLNVATRHSGATIMLGLTGDIKTVSDMLDHRDITITAKRYVKRINEKMIHAVNAMSEKMGLDANK